MIEEAEELITLRYPSLDELKERQPFGEQVVIHDKDGHGEERRGRVVGRAHDEPEDAPERPAKAPNSSNTC